MLSLIYSQILFELLLSISHHHDLTAYQLGCIDQRSNLAFELGSDCTQCANAFCSIPATRSGCAFVAFGDE